VSPNVMIMYFISSLPVSAPGTGVLTDGARPAFWTRLTVGVLPTGGTR
jgi:hypothetical protein